MNMYAKFQLRPPYGFWGDDFEYFFEVAIEPNQIQRFEQNSYAL